MPTARLPLAALALLFTLSAPALLRAQDPAALPSLSTPINPRITAGPHRPASVPEDYVITPFGYFHPSCVQSIAADETLLADGRIQHNDATHSIDAAIPACNFPRFTHDGLPFTATPAKSKPQVNGWIEDASIVPASPTGAYSSLLSLFTVPLIPHNDDGQLLYYFPGLEDITHTESILQPVLQFYQGQWAVANWNCCLNNITTESPIINVKPGDRIYGSISADCPPGGPYCATWTIFSLDLRSGKTTTLKHTPAANQIFNWAFGAVMEPYYVGDCSDYPPDHKMDFEVLVFDQNWRLVIRPDWALGVNSTQLPQCTYGIAPSPYDITIAY